MPPPTTPPRQPVRSPALRAYLASRPGTTQLFYADLAAITGVTEETLRRLNSRSQKRREANDVHRGDLPKPTGYERGGFGRGAPRPWWAPDAIATWLDDRPGQPGQPPKEDTTAPPS